MSDNRPVERNYTIDVMIAIGIIMVVVGHSFQPPFWYFPAYSFHMALFFFASGFLAKSADSLDGRIRIIKAKTKSQLLPYFGYNALFFGLTYLAHRLGIILPGNIPSFDSAGATAATLKAFFWQPFVDGHQLYLFIPAWFLITLYLVNVIFQIISFSANNRVQWTIYLCAVASMIALMDLNQSGASQLLTFAARTSFGLGLFLTGNLYAHYKQEIDRFILRDFTPLLCLVIWNIIASLLGPEKLAYGVVWGKMNYTSSVLPILASMIVICFTIWIANATTSMIRKPAFISLVSGKSFYIMIFHVTSFFIVNQALRLAGYINADQIKIPFYMHEPKYTWPLYIIAGIGLPIAIGALIQRAKSDRKRIRFHVEAKSTT